MTLFARRRLDLRSEDGYSLLEMVVAVFLFALVSGGFYQVLLAQTRSTNTTRMGTHIAEEARLGFNRMVRDVREADTISAASINAATGASSFTIKVNYNNDSQYTSDEILTYSYDPTAKTISLNTSGGTPEVLMSGVSPVVCSASTPCAAGSTTPACPATAYPLGCVFSFMSSYLDYDWNGDGFTTWQEVDDASCSSHGITGVGDCNGGGAATGQILDSGEFPYLTMISFGIKVTDGSRSNDFIDRAQMRN
nr:prepilin-type N-terminal cleavage/methylation domain-containing protein [Actinomycetota bacterium]